jgi:hypothetical protein
MEGKEKMIRYCLNNGVCLSNNYIVSIMASACFSNNYIVSIMASACLSNNYIVSIMASACLNNNYIFSIMESACLSNNYIFVYYFIHYEKSIIVTAVFNTASVQEL